MPAYGASCQLGPVVPSVQRNVEPRGSAIVWHFTPVSQQDAVSLQRTQDIRISDDLSISATTSGKFFASLPSELSHSSATR